MAGREDRRGVSRADPRRELRLRGGVEMSSTVPAPSQSHAKAWGRNRRHDPRSLPPHRRPGGPLPHRAQAGRGRDGHGVSGRRSAPQAEGRDQGPEAGAGGPGGSRSVPGGDPDHGEPAAPPHPAPLRQRRGRRVRLLRDAVPGGGVAPGASGSGEAAAGGRAPGATSTPWRASCTRCWPATRPTPAPPPRR
jgi:hypothetical protein